MMMTITSYNDSVRLGLAAQTGILEDSAMSALGQKQTFAVQNVMSALPPKADICSALTHVR
jgi:hypothetical protein